MCGPPLSDLTGFRIVTASYERTARIWDATTGTEIAALVTVSGDNTAGIGNAARAKETAVLRGHEGSVFSAAFSPDGSRTVTMSNDDTARIWDATTGREIAVQDVGPAPQ